MLAVAVRESVRRHGWTDVVLAAGDACVGTSGTDSSIS